MLHFKHIYISGPPKLYYNSYFIVKSTFAISPYYREPTDRNGENGDWQQTMSGY